MEQPRNVSRTCRIINKRSNDTEKHNVDQNVKNVFTFLTMVQNALKEKKIYQELNERCRLHSLKIMVCGEEIKRACALL
jgi:hypothetical protein